MSAETDTSASAGRARTLRASMESALDAHDSETAVSAALDAVAAGDVDVPTLYDDVLTALMVSVGDRWRTGEVRVWQEHLATVTVTTVVEALHPRVSALAAEAPPCGRTVLVAAPALEQHVLGLRMVADLFRIAGWRVVYLGANTPSREIVEATSAVGADSVIMSASTTVERVGLRHVADCLEREIPGIRVWVGGAAFAREHEGWSEAEILDLRSVEEVARATCAGEPETP